MSRGLIAVLVSGWLMMSVTPADTLAGAGPGGPAPVAPSADAQMHFERGVAAKRAGDYGVAATEFRAAVAASPTYVAAHWFLAWVLVEQQDRPGAIAAFRAALALPLTAEQVREAQEALRRLGVVDSGPRWSAASAPPTELRQASEPFEPVVAPLAGAASVATAPHVGPGAASVATTGPVRPLAAVRSAARLLIVRPDATALWWDRSAEPALLQADLPDGAAAAAVCPTLRWAVGDRDGTVHVYDGPALKRSLDGSGHGRLLALALSPSGEHLAALFADRTARRWSADDGALVNTVQAPPDTLSLALGPQADLAWVCGPTAMLRMGWHDGRTDKGLSSPMLAASQGADGLLICGGAGGGLLALEPPTAQRESWAMSRAWPGHAGAVRGISGTPASGSLVSVGDDKVVRCWDGASGAEALLVRMYGERDWAAWTPAGRVEGTPEGRRQLAAEAHDDALDAGWVGPAATPGLVMGVLSRGYGGLASESPPLPAALRRLARDLQDQLQPVLAAGRHRLYVAPIRRADDQTGYLQGCEGSVLADALASAIKPMALESFVYDGPDSDRLTNRLRRDQALDAEQLSRLQAADPELDVVVAGRIEQRGGVARLTVQAIGLPAQRPLTVPVACMATLDVTSRSLGAGSYAVAGESRSVKMPHACSPHMLQPLARWWANPRVDFGLTLIVDGHPVEPTDGADGGALVTVPCGKTFKVRLTNHCPVEVGAALLLDGANSIIGLGRSEDPALSGLWILPAGGTVEIPGWWSEAGPRSGFNAFSFSTSNDGFMAADPVCGTIEARFYTRVSDLAMAASERGRPVIGKGGRVPGSTKHVEFVANPEFEAKLALCYRETDVQPGGRP